MIFLFGFLAFISGFLALAVSLALGCVWLLKRMLG